MPAMTITEAAQLRLDSKLHLLQASIIQDGKIRASARAKFLEGSPGVVALPMPKNVSMRALSSDGRKRL